MIIPVFDVKDNSFVCGQSGNRDEYSTLNSIYGDKPLDIVRNLKKSGVKLIYIADLDKIEDNGDNSKFIHKINEVIPVMLDNGANSLEDITLNKNICTYTIIASETMTSLEETVSIFEDFPYDNLLLSIDIKDNQLLVKDNSIKIDDIISLVNHIKMPYTIILNITQVGTKKGNDNQFIKDIVKKTPYTQHIIAGGVSNESISEYRNEGINNFLIGTILHDGTLLEEYKW